MRLTVQDTKKRLLNKIKTAVSTKSTPGSEESSDQRTICFESSDREFLCQRCADPIVYGQHPFYVCVEYSCNHTGEHMPISQESSSSY